MRQPRGSRNARDARVGHAAPPRTETAHAKCDGHYAKCDGDYAKCVGDYAKCDRDYAKCDRERAKCDRDCAKCDGDCPKCDGDYAKCGRDSPKEDTVPTKVWIESVKVFTARDEGERRSRIGQRERRKEGTERHKDDPGPCKVAVEHSEN